MVDFKFREENNEKRCDQHVTSTGQKKKSESPRGIEPETFRSPLRYSNHWATMGLWRAGPYTNTSQEPWKWLSSHESFVAQPVRASDRSTEGHRFNFCWGLRFFLCSVLVTCWSHHLSWLLLFPVITELVCLLKFAQAPFHRTWLHTVSK